MFLLRDLVVFITLRHVKRNSFIIIIIIITVSLSSISAVFPQQKYPFCGFPVDSLRRSPRLTQILSYAGVPNLKITLANIFMW